MRRYDDNFKSILVGLDFETIENSLHSVFGLSKELKFIYFNKAWFEFAKQNNGEPNISSHYPIGTPIVLALSDEIKDFYIGNYKKVLQDLTVWKHEYECSSADLYRVFYQDVYPLKNGEGIIVVNSLKIERPFEANERALPNLKPAEYLNKKGIIIQCTNCRRTQRANELQIWDWVPSFVSNMSKNISHSLCPICYDYYWKYRKD